MERGVGPPLLRKPGMDGRCCLAGLELGAEGSRVHVPGAGGYISLLGNFIVLPSEAVSSRYISMAPSSLRPGTYDDQVATGNLSTC